MTNAFHLVTMFMTFCFVLLAWYEPPKNKIDKIGQIVAFLMLCVMYFASGVLQS